MKKNCDVAENKFRPLKKELQTVWKIIKNSVSIDQFPEQERLDVFLALSRVMVSYPGFGDQNYKAYIRVCDEMYENFVQKDLVAFQNSFLKLKEIRHDCHEMYRF